MPSWGPFQPKLFYDSVKIRSINKNSFRLLQKLSGLWPTPVFQSQNLDSAMKMTDSPRVRDLYSIISWETTRSAEKMHFCTDIATCEGTDRCQPIESCAGSQTPCAVPLGFPVSLYSAFSSITQHPTYYPSAPRDKQGTWSQPLAAQTTPLSCKNCSAQSPRTRGQLTKPQSLGFVETLPHCYLQEPLLQGRTHKILRRMMLFTFHIFSISIRLL